VINARTKKLVNDYLKVDQTVFKKTKMCAFFMGKIVDSDGEKRAETVLQLMQKMRDDVTDQRALLMREITDFCTGACCFYRSTNGQSSS
jgi:hypothetical protein